MVKPKKTKSGKWNIHAYAGTKDGKRVYRSFTANTKDEVVYQYSLWRKDHKEKKEESSKLTVGQAIDKYIELCEVLSPTTKAGYEEMRRNRFKSLMDIPITDLTETTLQTAINAESRIVSRRGKEISAKTIKNAYGLINAALGQQNIHFNNVKLPKKTVTLKEYPDPADVFKAVKGTDIELPCLLALWLSFSMSEIRGLTCKSIRNGMIHIDQVLVDVKGEKVVKQNAKVGTRNRKLTLPPYLAELINKADAMKLYKHTKEDSFLVTYTPFTINRKLKQYLAEYGIEGLTFHSLRHLNASVMLALNIPNKYAMERGGWSTPHTMQEVYQHTLSTERRAVDNIIDSYFEKIISGNATQNSNSDTANT